MDEAFFLTTRISSTVATHKREFECMGNLHIYGGQKGSMTLIEANLANLRKVIPKPLNMFKLTGEKKTSNLQ